MSKVSGFDTTKLKSLLLQEAGGLNEPDSPDGDVPCLDLLQAYYRLVHLLTLCSEPKEDDFSSIRRNTRSVMSDIRPLDATVSPLTLGLHITSDGRYIQ